MERLIDADLLMEKLNVFNDREHGNEHFINGIETAKELLEYMPTAYDVEKVMEQLEERRKRRTGVLSFILGEAIEIVRKGGVE